MNRSNNRFTIVGIITEILDLEHITIRVLDDEDNGKFNYFDVVIPKEMEYIKPYIKMYGYIGIHGYLERKQLSGGISLIATESKTIAMQNEEENETRKCSRCGKEMNKGYCIDNGIEYYCSDDCLYSKYHKDEYLEMYDNGDAYWTEWED